MRRFITRTALAGSSAILGSIGGALMFAPQKFLEMSDVIVVDDPSLMSELTAPSGVLLITSALMMLGAVRLRFADLGLMSGAIVYGSYGLSRLVSIIIHGVPSQPLIAAALVELGVATLLAVLRMRGALAKRPDIAHAYLGEVI